MMQITSDDIENTLIGKKKQLACSNKWLPTSIARFVYYPIAISILYFILTVSQAGAQTLNCNFLCNTDFEDNIVTSPGSMIILHQDSINCWRTTATDQQIEVWNNGFSGVPSFSGSQFIELNAYMPSTIYQEFNPIPGATAIISFAHRGRAGVDVMSAEIGPVGGPYFTLGTFSAGTSAWVYNTVSYTFPSTPGRYTLRFNSVSAAGGSTVGNFLDAINVSLPTPNIQSFTIQPTCANISGGSVSLIVTGATPPYSYQWSNGLIGTDSIAGLSFGSYTVIITDVYGCTASDTFDFPAIPVINSSVVFQSPTCHSLSNGSISITTTAGTPPFQIVWSSVLVSGFTPVGLPAGVYVYNIVDANQCQLLDTIVLSDPPPVVIQLQAQPDSVCPGDSSLLSAYGAASYQWYDGSVGNSIYVTPTTISSYSVMGMDANGCASTMDLTVGIKIEPEITIQSDTICSGYQFSPMYSVLFPGETISQYAWDFGDGQTSVDISPTHSYANPGFYTISCYATGSNGCTNTAFSTVLQTPPPEASFSLSSTVACIPHSISVTDESTADLDTIVSWLWSPSCVSGGPSYTITCDTPGTFPIGLIIITANGCTDDTLSSSSLQVYDTPGAGFELSSQTISELSPNISLNNISNNANQYYWNFGDGDESFEFSPNHSYEFPGVYNILQVVTNEWGCKDSLYKKIVVEEEPQIYVPSCFTPNGDAKNDFFEAIVYRVTLDRMDIFDRWGQCIYSTTVPLPWDGTINGTPVAIGVYNYLIKYHSSKVDDGRLAGRVTLMR